LAVLESKFRKLLLGALKTIRLRPLAATQDHRIRRSYDRHLPGNRNDYLSSEREEGLLSTLQINAEVRKHADGVLADQFRRARDILQGQRAELEWLAAQLYGSRTLSADEVRDVVEAQPRLNFAGRSL
jgi:hypothetical protein